jgi:hypothetical protein
MYFKTTMLISHQLNMSIRNIPQQLRDKFAMAPHPQVAEDQEQVCSDAYR